MPHGALIALRPSMVKFESEARNLKVCTYSRPLPFYLNCQIIMALLTLGVPADTFLGIFHAIVRRLDSILDGGDTGLEVRCIALCTSLAALL
jgi:RNA dependent RNA polymerase